MARIIALVSVDGHRGVDAEAARGRYGTENDDELEGDSDDHVKFGEPPESSEAQRDKKCARNTPIDR